MRNAARAGAVVILGSTLVTLGYLRSDPQSRSGAIAVGIGASLVASTIFATAGYLLLRNNSSEVDDLRHLAAGVSRP